MTCKLDNHYFKDVSTLNVIDIYRILELYEVNDPCIQHAIKKLLCAGIRNGGKNKLQDYREACSSIERHIDMRIEDIQRQ